MSVIMTPFMVGERLLRRVITVRGSGLLLWSILENVRPLTTFILK